MNRFLSVSLKHCLHVLFLLEVFLMCGLFAVHL